jgi:hypothetical protein
VRGDGNRRRRKRKRNERMGATRSENRRWRVQSSTPLSTAVLLQVPLEVSNKLPQTSIRMLLNGQQLLSGNAGRNFH